MPDRRPLRFTLANAKPRCHIRTTGYAGCCRDKRNKTTDGYCHLRNKAPIAPKRLNQSGWHTDHPIPATPIGFVICFRSRRHPLQRCYRRPSQPYRILFRAVVVVTNLTTKSKIKSKIKIKIKRKTKIKIKSKIKSNSKGKSKTKTKLKSPRARSTCMPVGSPFGRR